MQGSISIFVCTLVLTFSFSVFADTENSSGLRVDRTEVASGIYLPWALEFLSADELLISQRTGRLVLLNIKTKDKTLLKGLPEVTVRGQGGLLDLEKHPDYKNNGWIYVSYSTGKSRAFTTEIARFKINKDQITDWQTLFTAQPSYPTSHHFGSRIAFDDQGYLFFSVGDRGRENDAQDVTKDNGKIHRLLDNGKAPKDNPFYDQKKSSKSIWSIGHRNPQGLFFDKATKTLWAHEHGPQGGDEINPISKGKNYGWPVISYGDPYGSTPSAHDSGTFGEATAKKGMEQPYYYYKPSIAPSDFVIYNHPSIPEWANSFFLGSLVQVHLNRTFKTADGSIKEERLLEDFSQRVRSLAVGPEGGLYVGVDGGKIIRLTKASPLKPQ